MTPDLIWILRFHDLIGMSALCGVRTSQTCKWNAYHRANSFVSPELNLWAEKENTELLPSPLCPLGVAAGLYSIGRVELSPVLKCVLTLKKEEFAEVTWYFVRQLLNRKQLRNVCRKVTLFGSIMFKANPWYKEKDTYSDGKLYFQNTFFILKMTDANMLRFLCYRLHFAVRSGSSLYSAFYHSTIHRFIQQHLLHFGKVYGPLKTD